MSAFKAYILLTCFILFLDVAVGQKETVDIGSESQDLTAIVRSYSSKVAAGTCSHTGEQLPDDTDCNIFYVCEGTPPTLTPVRYNCIPDNVPFNPNTNECDPNYTCELGIKCTASGQKLENPDNCASYYICSATLDPVLVYCGENQFYSQDYGNCRNTTYVDCGERPGCINQGDSFPNYKDCNSFFACNESSFPIKLYCPSGQSYDSTSNRCLPSGDAECVTTIITVTPTVTPTILTTKTTAPTTLTTSTPAPTTLTTSTPVQTTTSRPTIPTNGCTEPALTLPDPYNCGKFYLCPISLKPALVYCNSTAQLIYDPIYENCNYKDEEICDSGVRPPIYPAEFTPGDPTSTCTELGNLYPEPSNCQLFYKCNADGIRDQYKCPEGLSFNPASKTCDVPDAVSQSVCTIV